MGKGRNSAAALSELRRHGGPVSAQCKSVIDPDLLKSITAYTRSLRSTRPGLPENKELNRFLHSVSLANLVDCAERKVGYMELFRARVEIDMCADEAIREGLSVPPSIALHSEKVHLMIFEQVAYATALAGALKACLAGNETRFTFVFGGASKEFHIFEARAELTPYFKQF